MLQTSYLLELKEQLPLRLDVIADRRGSRVRLISPWLQDEVVCG